MCFFSFLFSSGDPVELLSWLLNTLHYALCAGDRKKSSVVHDTFQGEMKIYTRKLPPPTEVYIDTDTCIFVHLFTYIIIVCITSHTYIHIGVASR